MSDERILYAGDLTTDQIMRRIEVKTESGAVVTDVLVEVRYFQPTDKSLGHPRVWVRFENVMPVNRVDFARESDGFWLADISQVKLVTR